MTTTVLLAGATGMLGNRISAHLLDRADVALRLLVRAPAPAGTAKARAVDALTARGATVVRGDVTDPASLDAATRGVDVVVSALQGGPDVVVDGQIALAEAAARQGVRRFLPSDFAIDPGILDLSAGTATVWGTGDEPFNLTTVDDTARFAARRDYLLAAHGAPAAEARR